MMIPIYVDKYHGICLYFLGSCWFLLVTNPFPDNL